MSSNILDKYITDNNIFYENWRNNRKGYWELKIFQEALKGGLDSSLMPSPYFGDPKNCCAVIININPGLSVDSYGKNSADKEAEYIAEKGYETYYDYAKDNQWMMSPVNVDPRMKDASDWWLRRKPWIESIANHFHAKGTTPFALELCPWHSVKWSGMKLTDDVKVYVRDRVLEPAAEAVKVSNTGVALCVSKVVYNTLLQCGAKLEVCEHVWTPDSINDWPKKDSHFIQRCYSLLSYKGTYFLCTWAQGGNNAPQKENFKKVEKQIIDIIKQDFLKKQ